MSPVNNFGCNLSFQPAIGYTPASEQELLEILNAHRGETIRAVGRLHSWSELPVTEGVLIDLRKLDQVVLVPNGETPTASVGAGCQIKRVIAELARQGDCTLPSLGLIDEQAIAGAISTGTHGSGKHSLSHYVVGVRVARYDPETDEAVIVEIADGDELRAARCALGTLGIIVSVRMQCRPVYRVEEHFRRYDSVEEILAREEEFPLQQFYLIPWSPAYFAQHRRETERHRSRLRWLYQIYWTAVFDIGMHLLILFAIRIVRGFGFTRFLFRRVIPLGVIRGWKVTDRSERILTMQHELFRHLETELFVHRSDLPQALAITRELIEFAGGTRRELSPVVRQSIESSPADARLDALAGSYCQHYPVCVRRILPDDTLISMSSGTGEPWYSISLITYAHPNRRESFFHFSRVLAHVLREAFGARPHWGKFHLVPPSELRGLYPQFAQFQSIREQADPAGRFLNRWTRELLITPDSE